MEKILKKIVIVLAFFGIVVGAEACSNGKTLVSYKGGKITEGQYYDKMKQSQAGQSLLANMIVNATLEQQYGSKVSKKSVNKAFDTTKKQYGPQFDSVLQQQGLTPATFKESIRTSLLMQQALRSIKKVTPKQEQEAWKNYQPKVKVQHILVSKKEEAQNIIDQLNKGANFDDLAKKYSIDSANKNNGGKLPAFDSTDKTLDPDFKKAAFALKTGQYTTTPVKSQFGYHVIKMIDHPDKGSFKAHKKAIDKQIYNQMAQDQSTMQDVLSQVLKNADVNIKDNDLKDVLTKYVTGPVNAHAQNDQR